MIGIGIVRVLFHSLLWKPKFSASSISGSGQNLASRSAFTTWMCFRVSSLEYILNTYLSWSLKLGLIFYLFVWIGRRKSNIKYEYNNIRRGKVCFSINIPPYRTSPSIVGMPLLPLSQEVYFRLYTAGEGLFIRKLSLHEYICRFLLPLRWLSVPPRRLPCFLFQMFQPLRKSPSIGRSGWRIAFRNSFSLIMKVSVLGCSGCVCGSSFSLVLLYL